MESKNITLLFSESIEAVLELKVEKIYSRLVLRVPALRGFWDLNVRQNLHYWDKNANCYFWNFSADSLDNVPILDA